MDYQEWKEQLYDYLCGLLDEDTPFSASVPAYVEDEFRLGKPCGEWYEAVYGAADRLNQRLGTQEDPDIDCIIQLMLHISRRLSLKMFDYGVLYQKEQQGTNLHTDNTN